MKLWLDDSGNFPQLEREFNSTSQYAKLKSVFTVVAGRLLYIRFKASTGDAMGMNMISKVCVRFYKYKNFFKILKSKICRNGSGKQSTETSVA